jgi:hypothetical protein
MSSNRFIKEVVAFVKEYLPNAKWQMEKDYAVLYLDENKKSVCFLANNALSTMHDIAHRFYIIEYFWEKNKESSKSRLCSLMGVTKRIHARQCVLKRIDKTMAKSFVDANHTMGYAGSYYNYGLFLKDELVAVACFSKGRRMDRLPEDKKSFELIRFCNKNFYTVVGGLSKLIHNFEVEHAPGDMMTYVDIAWGEPYAYYALGFVLDKITPSVTTSIPQLNATAIEFTNKGNYKLIKHLGESI